MRPTWLIEANVEGLPSERYQSEIRRQKMACHVVKYLPSLAVPKDIAGTESLPMDSCVIFCGTHTLMRHIHVSRRWRPGGWWAVENLACSTYYAHFGKFLLNRDYSFLPIAEALRLTESLFARYAQDGLVFVRPDAVDKRFPGTLTDQSTFTHKFFSTKFDPTALILIARPKKLSYEWRLIVANGKVVAGSQYLNANEREEVAGVPDEVRRAE